MICPECKGARKVTYRGLKNGRQYKRVANCVSCLGTGVKLEAGTPCPKHPYSGVRREGDAEVCRAFGCEWRHALEVKP